MKKFNILMILAVLTLVWGCKDSDGDGGSNSSTSAQYLTPGTDARPSWQKPDYNEFENTMYIQFQLQEQFASYVTDQDLMCAMIGGEVRALTAPNESEGDTYFPLSIAANGGEEDVTIAYYCDRLHRIYKPENYLYFDTSMSPTDAEGNPYVLTIIPNDNKKGK